MKRRKFIISSYQSALLVSLLNGCTGKDVLNDRSISIDTPEKRAVYLKKMLKALCTDIGPHPIGSTEYEKAALIVKKEMERSLPLVELDTFTFERWVLKSEPELYIGERWVEVYPAHGSSGTPLSGITGTLKKIDDKGGIPLWCGG